MSDILIIGIAGGSGSGKTTLAENLLTQFGTEVGIIRHDNYYKRRDNMTYDERAKINYDEPNAFDNELLRSHLLRLRDGLSVDCPVYDYTIHNRSDKTVRIEPKKVMIVEGILIFESLALCDLFDIKIFVDTDADVRIVRRILRDVSERERSLESVVWQYLTTVKPMHEQYVEPSKKRADIIIPEGGQNNVALEMITDRIKSHLNK
ncbi:MAG: uridine kinase [Clostridia bacterium]|nr:uridine kinase [Clostridia bacterium]MBQ6614060.1 uridine kinase [Clostridia bacterium]